MLLPELHTERLLLRAPEMSDEHFMFQIRSDAAVAQYIDRKLAENTNEIIDFLEKIRSNIEEKRSYLWLLTLKADQKPIGSVCLWNLSEDGLMAELGYEMLPDYHGKGYMQEAVEQVLEYGFKVLHLHKIEAWCHLSNLPSLALLHRCRFQLDRVEQEISHSKNDTVQELGVFSLKAD
jgi:ribosomal-protein-alanine N-acetyltransferase